MSIHHFCPALTSPVGDMLRFFPVSRALLRHSACLLCSHESPPISCMETSALTSNRLPSSDRRYLSLFTCRPLCSHEPSRRYFPFFPFSQARLRRPACLLCSHDPPSILCVVTSALTSNRPPLSEFTFPHLFCIFLALMSPTARSRALPCCHEILETFSFSPRALPSRASTDVWRR